MTFPSNNRDPLMVGDALPFLFILLLTLFWSKTVQAETYFVGQGKSASDSNLGTLERSPMRTITQALEKVRPGDQVVVLEGDYRKEDSGYGLGVIPFTVSGTASRPISISARQKVLVSRFMLKKIAHVSIQGFTFQSRDFLTYPNWRDMPHVVRDLPESKLAEIDFLKDWETRRPVIKNAFKTYFELIRSLEYDVAIDLEQCQSITVSRNSIEGYWAGIQCKGVDHADIESNEIRHCVSGIYTWEPSPALTNSKIRGNVVTQCLDIGIDVRRGSNNVLIQGNQVSHSGISHIALMDGTSHSTIRMNRVWGGGYYSQTMEFPGSSALNLNGVGKGNIVEGNVAAMQIDPTEVDGNGIILDLIKEGEPAIIRWNVSVANMGSGLNTTASPNARIYGNLFIANGLGGSEPRNGAGIKLSRDEDIGHSIQLNLFALNRSAGVLGYHTIEKQRALNRNVYLSRTAPIVWDGYNKNERAYRELKTLRSATKWELNGIHLSLPK
jgi:Right handed beta helix region/Protein of unknown function (DUF1565)